MRLRIVLPKVNPEAITVPTRCAYAGCRGSKFYLRQEVAKPLRDTVYHKVQVHRYQCLKCRRTFRVYPEGTTHAQTSQRVKGLAVMLYLLGLSYGATSLALEALGVYLCKSRIYDAVQETAKLVPGLKRDQVFAGVKTPALGGDLTSVKCKGEWLPLGITVDPISGLALTIDALPAKISRRFKTGLSRSPRVWERPSWSPMMPTVSRRWLMRWACSIKCVKRMCCATPRT